MNIRTGRPFADRLPSHLLQFVAAVCVLFPHALVAQRLTGTLIGAVKDEQGGALRGAVVRVSSPALIGRTESMISDERGQLRFPILPPGVYVLDIELQGFASYHEAGIRIGASATIERTATLKLGNLGESIVVEGAGSRIEARGSGFETRFGAEDLKSVPTRRSSMFDSIRAAPGISPTSPASGTVTTISAFGSGTNENQFLIDGTNFTCPCNGIARAEPGVDFIQEVHIQSTGSSAEFGSVQGAVINIITRQGSDRFLYDASYYGQAAALTSQPVKLPYPGSGSVNSGYERARYRDYTTNLGGPGIRDRLWFFAGYQYLRDYDSQPGANPQFPRAYEQNKVFAKLTWRLAPGWQFEHSVHDERWVNPDPPTLVTPFEATLRRSASVPAITFGHLTHASKSQTVWDVRVARFSYVQDAMPSTGDLTTPSRNDSVTGITSGAPGSFSTLTIARTTGKATVSHYSSGFLRADHQWMVGTQFEEGGHHAINGVPTGVRFSDVNGQRSQAIAIAPFNVGGEAVTASAFASDAITIGNRFTINAGLRFDHARALSQDLPALDSQAHETAEIVHGLGSVYTWNLLSPRLGVTTKLTADGRTMLRGSYGRFSQGVMTGELEAFHPGATPVITTKFDPATGAYTIPVSVVDPRRNLQLDRETRAPHTQEYSIGIDREVGRQVSVAVAYVGKHGRDFIGWTDVGGQYVESTQRLKDDRSIPTFELVNGTASRLFLLTNPDGYYVTYNGLVMTLEKRRSHGWQAFGSLTLSKTYGLQPSSGTSAAGPQVSTVSPPQPLTFGRDPNDLTNAEGRLPGDRPHVFRVRSSVDVPRTGVVLGASFQYFTGKPWAASALVSLPQNNSYRVLIEPRGARRLSSQSLLDLRVSKTLPVRTLGRIELRLDVLNALNDTAEEGLASENFFSPTFAQPALFMDPRRAMLSATLNLGK